MGCFRASLEVATKGGLKSFLLAGFRCTSMDTLAERSKAVAQGAIPKGVIGFDAFGPAVQMRQCYVVYSNNASTPMAKEIGSTKKAGGEKGEENKLRVNLVTCMMLRSERAMICLSLQEGGSET